MKFFKLLPTGIIIFLTLSVSAQPGGYEDPKKLHVYARVYASYGFLTPGSFKGSSYLKGGEPVRFQAAKNAMGNGIYYGAGFGIIFNEFWNVGINGEYLSGSKIHIEQNISSAESKSFPASGYSMNASRTYNYSIASIIPNVVFKSISTPSFYIYTRLGLQIGIPLKMTENFYQRYHYQDPPPRVTGDLEDRNILTTYNANLSLKPGLGYQLSTGIQFLLTKKLRGFLEITANRISYNRDKYEETEKHQYWTDQRVNRPFEVFNDDYSRVIHTYINNGPEGFTVSGNYPNQVYTHRKAQDPVHVNAITAGLGLSYIF